MAQKENANWVSGDNFGINFNTSPPSFLDNSVSGSEGCASVSTPSGRLLFYCNGVAVRDSTHHLMPNGSGLLGLWSSTQGVAIASVPGSDSLFYLFTVDAYETWGGFKLRYSIVDMSLNSGKGDIIPGFKNIEIDSLMSEKMQIVGSCGRNWLLTHHQTDPAFYAYDLSRALPFGGFIRPVISVVGPVKGDLHYEVGEMKVSRNFRRLALANVNLGYSHSDVQLYDFSQKTGRVSNYRQVDSFPSKGPLRDGPYSYGIAFSADAGKLYCSRPPDTLFQYDLLRPAASSIRSSRYSYRIYNIWGMRLADDKMVYLKGSGSGYQRIRDASLPAPLCTIESASFAPLGPLTAESKYGLGNHFVSLTEYNKDTTFTTTEMVLCKGWPLSISGLDYDLYRWSDGDTASRKTFTKPGKYWLNAISSCLHRVDTFIITEKTGDSTYSRYLDTALCTGLPITLEAPFTGGWYIWHDGDTAKLKKGSAPLDWVAVSSGADCHIRFDTMRVRGLPVSVSVRRRDTVLCPFSPLELTGMPGADLYRWWDGSTGPKKSFVPADGKYWVYAQTGCVAIVDTLNVSIRPADAYHTKSTVNLCDGRATPLPAPAGFTAYRWSTGDTVRVLYASAAGKFWVQYAKECVLYTDTFYTYKKPFTRMSSVKDTPFCFTSSGILHVPEAYDSILWSGGNPARDTTLYVDADLSFRAVDSKACVILDQVYTVRFVSYSSPLKDTFTCNGDTLWLDAGIGKPSASYRWSSGDTLPRVKAGWPGTRYVFIRYGGCVLADTVQVADTQLRLSIGADTVLCQGTMLRLVSNVPDATYRWSTGATDNAIEVKESGRYSLMVSRGSCSAGAEVNVRFVACHNCASVPNAFTPNNDNINDYFKPLLHCPATALTFQIYDRWGKEIYRTENPNGKWDGTSAGMPVDAGVYFYLMRLRFEAQGDREELIKGNVLLIR